MEPTNDAVMCPTCNVPMVDGVCPQCGTKAEGTDSAPATEAPSDPASAQ